MIKKKHDNFENNPTEKLNSHLQNSNLKKKHFHLNPGNIENRSDDKMVKIDTIEFKLQSLNKKCKLKMNNKHYFNMRFNLPMKMQYFDQLLEMVGLDDTLDNLLNREKNYSE